MKNILKQITPLLLLLFVAACENPTSEAIFDKSINERFDEKKEAYLKTLQVPEYGWKATYVRKEGVGAINMLFDFLDDHTVVLFSDYLGRKNHDTITFRIDKMQKIELVFETHAIFHQLYNINKNRSEGEYVFNITAAEADSVVLTSKTDNGYGGKLISVMNLIPAGASDWDVTLLYRSENQIAGDIYSSVFRGIEYENTILADFTYNPEIRTVSINYVDASGNIVQKTCPIIIKQDGFELMEALNIGAITLHSFVYDNVLELYMGDSGERLIHSSEPNVPLPSYEFGKFKNGSRFNYLERYKSSASWLEFFAELNEDLAAEGLSIERFYLRDILEGSEVSNIHIYTEEQGKLRYYFTYEIKEDGKIYFTPTGDYRMTPEQLEALQPFIDKVIGSQSGYFIRYTDENSDNDNDTFSLINADDPSIEINYYAF